MVKRNKKKTNETDTPTLADMTENTESDKQLKIRMTDEGLFVDLDKQSLTEFLEATRIQEHEEDKLQDAMLEAIETLKHSEGKQLDQQTDLDPYIIPQLTVVKMLADHYPLKSLRTFLNSYESFRISKNRRGREEILESIKHIKDIEIAERMQMGMDMNPMIEQNTEVPQKKKKRFFFF